MAALSKPHLQICGGQNSPREVLTFASEVDFENEQNASEPHSPKHLAEHIPQSMRQIAYQPKAASN